jgi:hypothetical protein
MWNTIGIFVGAHYVVQVGHNRIAKSIDVLSRFSAPIHALLIEIMYAEVTVPFGPLAAHHRFGQTQFSLGSQEDRDQFRSHRCSSASEPIQTCQATSRTSSIRTMNFGGHQVALRTARLSNSRPQLLGHA